MLQEQRLGTELLETTGYNTWFDFVLQITGSRFTGDLNLYKYKDAKGQPQELELNISQAVLEQMALIEAREWLPMLNIQRFSDYQQLIDGYRMHVYRSEYWIDTVFRNKEGKVGLSRIRISVDDWERLISWEEKYKDIFIFSEETCCCCKLASSVE